VKDIKKHCCKNCISLNFYDTYFCGSEEVQNIERQELLQIEDIENNKCELFVERKDKFWLNEEW